MLKLLFWIVHKEDIAFRCCHFYFFDDLDSCGSLEYIQREVDPFLVP